MASLTNLATGAYTIETAWFGVSSVTGNGTITTGSFTLDNFDSRRTTAP